jgi:predicted ester cyclase
METDVGRSNKELVRRYLREAYDKGKPELVDDYFAPEYVNHDPAPGLTPDREGEKMLVAMFSEAFPDLESTVHEQIADGDLVFSRWTAVGTHKGPVMGVAPTGRRITMSGHEITRIRDGKVVEYWVNWDAAGFMRQLGAIPDAGRS